MARCSDAVAVRENFGPMQNDCQWGRIRHSVNGPERKTIMSVLEWVRDPVGHLKKYTDLGAICLQDSSRFEDCDQVWAIVGIVFGLVCLVVLAFIARHFYREYAAHQRYRAKRMAEMGVAPPEVMNKYVWSDEKVLDTGLTREEMVQRIKEAKVQKQAGFDGKPGGDPALGHHHLTRNTRPKVQALRLVYTQRSGAESAEDAKKK